MESLLTDGKTGQFGGYGPDQMILQKMELD